MHKAVPIANCADFRAHISLLAELLFDMDLNFFLLKH